ncbi:MAG: hypothetical protein P8Z67_14320, partial [Gammaproteobacteria bacterium]
VRTVPTEDYVVDIRPGSDTTSIVGRVQAPLKTLGLSGMTAMGIAGKAHRTAQAHARVAHEAKHPGGNG